jgi:hypothetical protein
MTDYDFCENLIKTGKEVLLRGNKGEYYGIPVDGEKYLNQLGMSAGFIHLVDVNNKQDWVTYCGIGFFRKNVEIL